jgi:hypothetical protein
MATRVVIALKARDKIPNDRLSLSFARVEEDTISVTVASGPRAFSFDASNAGDASEGENLNPPPGSSTERVETGSNARSRADQPES